MPTSPVNPPSPATTRFTVSPSKPPRPISRALVIAQEDAGSRDLGSATAAAVAAAAATAAEADDEGVLAKVDQSKAEDEGVLADVDQSKAEDEGVLAKVDESEREGNGGIGRAGQSEQYAGVEKGEDEAYTDTDAGSDFAVEGQTVSAAGNDTEHNESTFASAPGEAETEASREYKVVVTGVRLEESMANAREEAVAVLDHAEGGGAPGDAEECGVSAMAMSTSEGPSPSEAVVVSSGVDTGTNGDAFVDESVVSTVVEGRTADHSLSEIAVPKAEPPVVDSLHAEREEACEPPIVSSVNNVPTAEAATADAVVAVVDQTEASDHVTTGLVTADQAAIDQPKAIEETEVGDKAKAEEDTQGVAETAAAAAATGEAEGDAATAKEAVSTSGVGKTSLAYETESGAQSEPAASESVAHIATAPLETPAPQTMTDADIDVLVRAAEPADDAAKPKTVEVDATADAAKPTTVKVDTTESVVNAVKSVADAGGSIEESPVSAAGLGGDKSVRIPGEFPSTGGPRRSSAGDKSPRERGMLTAGKVEVGTSIYSVVCVVPQLWFARKTK